MKRRAKAINDGLAYPVAAQELLDLVDTIVRTTPPPCILSSMLGRQAKELGYILEEVVQTPDRVAALQAWLCALSVILAESDLYVHDASPDLSGLQVAFERILSE